MAAIADLKERYQVLYDRENLHFDQAPSKQKHPTQGLPRSYKNHVF
jgi:hypothetical protein